MLFQCKRVYNFVNQWYKCTEKLHLRLLFGKISFTKLKHIRFLIRYSKKSWWSFTIDIHTLFQRNNNNNFLHHSKSSKVHFSFPLMQYEKLTFCLPNWILDCNFIISTKIRLGQYTYNTVACYACSCCKNCATFMTCTLATTKWAAT